MTYSLKEVPEIRLGELRDHVVQQILDVVSMGSMNYKEACEENQEYLFVWVFRACVDADISCNDPMLFIFFPGHCWSWH